MASSEELRTSAVRALAASAVEAFLLKVKADDTEPEYMEELLAASAVKVMDGLVDDVGRECMKIIGQLSNGVGQ